jgi:IclR family transcriptional regulator, KDG regulon repressor
LRPRTGEFPYRTQVLERTFAILDALATSSKALDLAEIAQMSRIQKSTCYRLVRILERRRFAERDLGTSKYRLGSKLLELGARAAAVLDLATVARPYLERLSRESGETAHVAVLSDGEVVSIASADGQHALRMSVTVGGKSPVHCSSLGKSILAFLPDSEVNAMVRKMGLRSHTPNTITRTVEFKAELRQIRKRGFAIDNEELEKGLKCIGAPVRDHTGSVVAALSIAGASLRLTHRRVPGLAVLVVNVASDLSNALGYRP